jgi:hypothetical protein
VVIKTVVEPHIVHYTEPILGKLLAFYHTLDGDYMTRGMINLVPGQYLGTWFSKHHDWKMGFAKEFATE